MEPPPLRSATRFLTAVVLATCVGQGAVVAEGGTCRAARIAHRLVQTWREGRREGLQADLDDGDPWRVALVLCARGHDDVAAALAAGDEALGAQVARWRAQPPATGVVRALGAADAALEGGDAPRAAALYERLAREGGFVGAWAQLHGDLAAPGPDAVDALEAVEALAKSLGWARGEERALTAGAQQAREAGAFEHSLAAYERLIAHCEARKEVRLGAFARMDRASTLAMLGDHRRAVSGFEDTLALLAEDDPLRMDVLYNLGFTQYLMGAYAAALATQEKARAIALRFDAKDKAAECTTRLAEIELRLGESDRAVALAKEAIAQLEKLDAPDRYAEAHAALGDALAQRGDLAQSAAVHQKALELTRRLPGDHARDLAIGAVNLAIVRRRQGRLREARSLLSDALPRLESLRAEGIVAWTLRELALVDVAEGRWADALPRLDRALAIAEARDEAETVVQVLAARMEVYKASGDLDALMDAADQAGEAMQRTVAGLAETQGALARGQRARIYEMAIAAAVEADKPERLFRFLEHSRAGGLAEALANRREIREALIPKALREAEDQAGTAQAIARTRYLAAHERRDLVAARKARRALRAARTRTRRVQERIQRVSKAGVLYAPVTSLADVEALLDPGDALVLFAVLPAEVVAAVVTKAGVRCVDLGPAAPIEEACRGFSPDDSHAAQMLEVLRRRLVAPLKLDEDRRLLISPDAVLYRVPFAALLHGRDVAYVASATVFSLLAKDAPLHGTGVLALGDPVAEGFPRLPGSEAEAHAVGTTVLLGEKASEAGLVRAAATRPRWRAIHFACHGRLDDEHPMQSALALTGGDLTALDVLQLDLPADLVVLSACSTGRGRYVRGEGLLGLTRAFRFASGPRTIVSLWNVDDAATRALMTRFYELLEKHPAAHALRMAQAYVASQKRWAQPYYWAAWQLWGPL
jgi:tetratricopeptide (TPR) repeat protein